MIGVTQRITPTPSSMADTKRKGQAQPQPCITGYMSVPVTQKQHPMCGCTTPKGKFPQATPLLVVLPWIPLLLGSSPEPTCSLASPCAILPISCCCFPRRLLPCHTPATPISSHWEALTHPQGLNVNLPASESPLLPPYLIRCPHSILGFLFEELIANLIGIYY